MDNKIILEMVVKDLEEIKFLVESFSQPEKIDPLLIEIAATKAKAFYQELMLLSANNPVVIEKEEIIIPEEMPVAEDGTQNITTPEPTEDEAEIFDDNIVVEEHPIILPEIDTVAEEEIPAEEIAAEEFFEAEAPVNEEISAPVEDIDSTVEETVSEQDTSEEITEKVAEETIEISDEADVIEETTSETVVVDETNPENEVSESEQVEEAVVPEEPISEPENEISSEPVPEKEEENTLAEVENEEPSVLIENIVEAISEAKTNEEPVPVSAETEEIPVEEEPEAQKPEEQPVAEQSIYEKLAATTNPEIKTKGKPVDNIMNAIGINDKFMFSRELFANDAQKFEDAVNHLDSLSTFIEAIDFLEKNFKWTKNEASLKFMDLLKRRFQK